MSVRTFDLIASAAQTASGNGSSIAVNTLTMLDVVLAISAGSGTVSSFDLFLEGSADGGTTWYEIPADIVLEKAGAADQNSAATNQRDICTLTSVPSGGEVFVARYKHLPAKEVRVGWYIAGSTPSVTFSVRGSGK